jgi:quercetin dioxygenase-like cupin family protein
MSDTTTALAPAIGRRGEGEARWWLACLAEILITAEDTGGALSVLEITEPPGAEAPLHVHHGADETFLILEGGVTFEVGGAMIAARPGDVVFGPRRVPHRYVVGPAGCRMRFVLTPGGFEGLVREMSVPAGARTLPPPADEEPDWEMVAAIATAHGCELLG